MKLFKNPILGAALVAAFPFLVLGAMAYFSPAPAAIESPDVSAWWLPWTWGNQGAADLITEAANITSLVNYQTSTQWMIWACLAGAGGAVLAKIFEIKKLEDPRATQTADAAVERLFSTLKSVDEAATVRIARGARERKAVKEQRSAEAETEMTLS